MKKQLKLTLSMALLFLITFVSFGTIIINEKKEDLFMPHIKNKLEDYLIKNYKEQSNLKTKISYNKDKFILKVISEENNNYYFNIYYKDKEITDSYKKDYIEGNTYFKYLENKLQKDIKKTLDINSKIDIATTLDSMTSKIRKKVLIEEDIKSLEIYTLSSELIIEEWNSLSITTDITNFINKLEKEDIKPNSYILTITNSNNLNESIEITNITTDLIENNKLNLIIDDIINNINSKLLQQEKITYKYKK